MIEEILAPFVATQSLWVFGSRIGTDSQACSDLDLVIHSSEPLPFAEYLALKDALEFSALPMRVDLLDWQRLSPEFREVIQQNHEIWH